VTVVVCHIAESNCCWIGFYQTAACARPILRGGGTREIISTISDEMKFLCLDHDAMHEKPHWKTTLV